VLDALFRPTPPEMIFITDEKSTSGLWHPARGDENGAAR